MRNGIEMRRYNPGGIVYKTLDLVLICRRFREKYPNRINAGKTYLRVIHVNFLIETFSTKIMYYQ